jgi:hypothetical protein
VYFHAAHFHRRNLWKARDLRKQDAPHTAASTGKIDVLSGQRAVSAYGPGMQEPTRLLRHSPIFPTLALAACFAAGTLTGHAAEALVRIVVSNPHDLPLESATVEIPWADLKAKVAGLKDDVTIVDEASGAKSISQVYESADGAAMLLFQSDFPAKGSRTFRVEAGQGPAGEMMTARFVPERIDDFAWENDRVAFRVYGPKAQALLEAGNKTGVISNGIDIWAKSVSRMVVNDWYRKGDYHTDRGEGADFFKVGPTLGGGAPALRKPDGSIVPWLNFTAHRVIARGPVRLAFELDYAEITAGDVKASSTVRISMDRGSQFLRYHAALKSNKPGAALDYVAGLAKRPGTMPGEFPNARAQSLWGAIGGGGKGQLGMAVVLAPSQFSGFASDKDHWLALGKTGTEQKIDYLVGVAWTKAKIVKSQEDWKAGIELAAALQASPLQWKIEAANTGN